MAIEARQSSKLITFCFIPIQQNDLDSRFYLLEFSFYNVKKLLCGGGNAKGKDELRNR